MSTKIEKKLPTHFIGNLHPSPAMESFPSHSAAPHFDALLMITTSNFSGFSSIVSSPEQADGDSERRQREAARSPPGQRQPKSRMKSVHELSAVVYDLSAIDNCI